MVVLVVGFVYPNVLPTLSLLVISVVSSILDITSII